MSTSDAAAAPKKKAVKRSGALAKTIDKRKEEEAAAPAAARQIDPVIKERMNRGYAKRRAVVALKDEARSKTGRRGAAMKALNKIDTKGTGVRGVVATRLFVLARQRADAEQAALGLPARKNVMLTGAAKTYIRAMVHNMVSELGETVRPWMELFDRRIMTASVVLLGARQRGMVSRSFELGDDIAHQNVPVGTMRDSIYEAANAPYQALLKEEKAITEYLQQTRLTSSAPAAAAASDE